MTTVHITASLEYDVLIEHCILDKAGELAKPVLKGRTICIVSDDNVFPIYGKKVIKSFEKAGFRALSFVFPHGEKSKSIKVYTELLEFLLENRFTRSDCLAALGGGVVGDLTGFAAATYQRGIRFIQIPTTLLAMVDSSVGGKTAVNLEHGKNQVGAFYQPSMVICDPDTLKTLPQEQFLCGCGEVIKYAVFGSGEFFDKLKSQDVSAQLEYVITKSVEMKRDVVAQDERDTGARMILNLGHTVGHAIEACSNFEVLHGQGVAIGTAVISRAANKMGYLSDNDLDKILSLIKQYGLPTETDFSAEELYSAALADKKADSDSIAIVVPTEIGHAELKRIPKTELYDWIKAGI